MRFWIFSTLKRHKRMIVIILVIDLIISFIFLHKYTKQHFIEKSTKYIFKQLSQHHFFYETNFEIVDIHHEANLEDFEHYHSIKSKLPTVAIGLALTSSGVMNISAENINNKIPFLKTLLPSFCKTSTQGYSYHFYVAFDNSDPLFTDKHRSTWFTDAFHNLRRTQCSYVSEVHLHMIECHHNRKPAWAQNDAMMEAYLDNMQFYYRVNDDTVLRSPGWTQLYISTLADSHPPNIGVVGPKHTGGNHDILTYDFVHKKHIEIFGFYYPRLFTDWFADNWITQVYSPNRTFKLPQVKVVHTQTLGQRYSTNFSRMEHLQKQVLDDKTTLSIYLDRSKSVHSNLEEKAAVSFTLTSFHPDQVFGAIRNLNLVRLYLPQWQVHVYVRYNPQYSEKGRVHQKLSSLNATVHSIRGLEQLPGALLGYLIADEGEVDRFIVRDVHGRFSEREAGAIESWMKSDAGFHCMRDHPIHRGLPIVAGLWGARHNALMQALGTQSMRGALQEYFVESNGSRSSYLQQVDKIDTAKDNSLNEDSFLQNVIWPKVKTVVLCHDSLFCDEWPDSIGFPHKRQSQEYVGMKYKAFEVPKSMNVSVQVNIDNFQNDKCS